MLVCFTKKVFVTPRGKPLGQYYGGKSRASSSLSHNGSLQHATSVISESTSNASRLCCGRYASVFSVRTFCLSSSDFKKEGKPSGINKSKSMFNYTRKFLDGGMEEPKLVYNTYTGRPNPEFKIPFIGSGTSARRLQVLNKLFFENIKDIMTSGILESHLLGCNLHVTKVRVIDGLMGLHVFYLQTGSGPELSAEQLKNLGRVVRKELQNCAITSNVPPITFKKDETFDNVIEVERRLTIIAQADQQQQESGQLEAMTHLRLSSPPVPDEIFEEDFKYDPSSPLNFAAATAQRPNPKNKPRSRFTPFEPRFSYKREEHSPNISWNRPVRVQWAGPAPARSSPRQVPLPTNTFNLNRAAVMCRVENGRGRVANFKRDGIDVNVYEANMVDFSLERKLLEGGDLEQQKRWEPVLDIMPRSSLQRWAAGYSRRHGKGAAHTEHKKRLENVTAGEPLPTRPLDTVYEDIKYYDIEDELQARTDAPDYYEEDS